MQWSCGLGVLQHIFSADLADNHVAQVVRTDAVQSIQLHSLGQEAHCAELTQQIGELSPREDLPLLHAGDEALSVGTQWDEAVPREAADVCQAQSHPSDVDVEATVFHSLQSLEPPPRRRKEREHTRRKEPNLYVRNTLMPEGMFVSLHDVVRNGSRSHHPDCSRRHRRQEAAVSFEASAPCRGLLRKEFLEFL